MRDHRWLGALGASLVALVATGLPATPSASETTGPITDACPAEELADQGFADVPADGPHAEAVACLQWWEVARGRTDDSYAPAEHLARDAMASFLARLLRAAGVPLPASPGDAFTDDDSSVHHFAINRLAEVGILHGLGGDAYGPDADVTRGQIATLIVNAHELVTGSSLPAGDDAFDDDDGSVHESAINKAAAAGLARGIAPRTFAPDQPASREQVASFLARALQLLADAGLLEESPATRRSETKLTTEDCESLLGFLKEQSLPYVTPWGMEVVGAPAVAVDDDDSGGEGEPAAGDGDTPGAPPAAPEEPGTPEAVDDHSGTNNQEEGVDEADTVKTDGERLFTAVGDTVRAIDLTGPTPVVAGTLDLPAGYGRQLVLDGNRLLVITPANGWVDVAVADEGFAPTYEPPVTRLDLVDVTDISNMQILSTLTVDGSAVATRTVDGVARLVLETAPAHLFLGVPEPGQPEAEAAEENRDAVETSEAEDWLPHFEHTTAGGASVTSGPLLGCADVAVPPEFSGVGVLSVLSLDLDGDLTPGAVTGVLGSWGTVYA